MAYLGRAPSTLVAAAMLFSLRQLPGPAAVYAVAAQAGGVTLDSGVGLHPFGGLTLNTAGSPFWGSWDIARAVAVRPDGSGGWTLDGFGGIHAFGTAPIAITPAYWSNWDIARAIVVTSKGADGQPDGRQGYLLGGYGGLRRWGGAPEQTGWAYTGTGIWRGVGIHFDANGVPGGGGGEGWGGVPVFGGAQVNISGSPFWPNWDIARAVAVRPDGSGGWTLDGFGGIPAFGAAPAARSPTYWPNWDIARAMIFTSKGQDGQPDGREGYLLDGYGGLPPRGGGPGAYRLPPHGTGQLARASSPSQP